MVFKDTKFELVQSDCEPWWVSERINVTMAIGLPLDYPGCTIKLGEKKGKIIHMGQW